MKKITLSFSVLMSIFLVWSCAGLKGLGLNEQDAAAALKQMLSLGVSSGIRQGFDKEAVMTALFPEPARKTIRTIEQLGLSPELERFTTTMGAVATQTVTTSLPVFQQAIDNLSSTDAIRLVKAGGTSATDYLRTQSGDSLRRALRPIMQQAITEHKLDEQWSKVTKPVHTVAGNRLNLDLANLMSGMVSEAMFREIATRETEVRTQAAARTTPLLRQVFGRNWN